MNTIAWKCYRCDLTFRDESHVIIHKDISQHPVRQIELFFINDEIIHQSQKQSRKFKKYLECMIL